MPRLYCKSLHANRERRLMGRYGVYDVLDGVLTVPPEEADYLLQIPDYQPLDDPKAPENLTPPDGIAPVTVEGITLPGATAPVAEETAAAPAAPPPPAGEGQPDGSTETTSPTSTAAPAATGKRGRRK